MRSGSRTHIHEDPERALLSHVLIMPDTSYRRVSGTSGGSHRDRHVGREKTMKRYSDQFISDLAQLIRHGPEPFDRLVDDLSDPDRRQRLLEALGHLSRIASESTPQPISRSRSTRPFTYDDIKTPQVSGTDAQNYLNTFEKSSPQHPD